MLSADEPQPENVSPANRPSLPKWPFVIGDAILVFAALAVWASTDKLGTAQLLFCLGSIGLGAVIFVFPYVFENISSGSGNFLMGDSPSADVAGGMIAGENEWRRQARAAAEAVEHAARANAALESSARRFDARFAPLVEIHQSLTAVVAELREAAAARATASAGETLAIQREFERLRKEQAEKFKATEEKVAALGETLALLAGHLKSLPPRPAPLATSIEAPARLHDSSTVRIQKPSAVRAEEPVLAGAGVAAQEASPAFSSSDSSEISVPAEILDRPIVETSVSGKSEAPSLGSISLGSTGTNQPPASNLEPGEEKSMLARALARAQSSGQTPAVAGIIMARARRPRKSKFPMPVVVAAPAVGSELAAAVASESSAASANLAEREGWQSLTEGKFDAATTAETSLPEEALDQAAIKPAVEPEPVTIEPRASSDTSSAFRRSARAKIVALRDDDEGAAGKDAPVVFAPGRPDDSTAQHSGEPTQGELLAREAETIRKRRSSRSPVPACSLVARVLIGIGNKPFVRGTGPGLSLEKGVPMEFVEIGQWRWVAPGAVKEPLTLRILKNDEVPAEGDAIVLHPGQSLDISPVFPN
jgi:hypothetical protein